ncbi:DUF2141 domain-containing protein [Salinimicrobium sp. GXAS 041]|uniref:DUF2141 domain-containing protein n=1 Tax=Salinimicrobium sp. GXAS 041 TaxID=3400806 RepID=UPI003C753F87
MKNLILTTMFALGFVCSGIAQNQVEVIITNFENEKGNALVGLYNSEESFLENAWKSKSVVIKNGQVTVIFEDVPDGTYAVSAFHDEDSDQKLDMFLGFYPMEDYATSNNAPAKFGPPKWEDAKFELKNGEKAVQKIIMM